MGHPPDPAPGTELVGLEVCSTEDGHLIGVVESTRHLAYDGAPEADVVMVRRIHGDGALRAYELQEVREHIAEGTVIAPQRGIPGRSAHDPEPEAEAEI